MISSGPCAEGLRDFRAAKSFRMKNSTSYRLGARFRVVLGRVQPIWGFGFAQDMSAKVRVSCSTPRAGSMVVMPFISNTGLSFVLLRRSILRTCFYTRKGGVEDVIKETYFFQDVWHAP